MFLGMIPCLLSEFSWSLLREVPLILKENYNDPPIQCIHLNVPIRLVNLVVVRVYWQQGEGLAVEAESSNLLALNWVWRQRERKVK